MTTPDPPKLRRRRAAYGFQPRMAIGIIYWLTFFVIICLLIALPELLEILERVPDGPAQEEAAAAAMRRILNTRIYYALAGSIAVTGVAAYLEVLPGMRSPN